MGITWVDNILEINNNYPWLILYQDEYNYSIHENLNILINNCEKDFTYCILSLNTNVLHANILIYDLNNKTVERFDPYGNTEVYDQLVDNILEEELTWNTGLKYLRPSDYLPVAGFQLISDELNPLNQKAGDFGGYCLAWCIWYLEHRLKNKNVKPNILVEKLIKQINLSKNSFNEYIRNYANHINKYRIEYLKEAGVNEKKISNTFMDNHTEFKINNFIKNKLK
jgi:hypothetical protein